MMSGRNEERPAGANLARRPERKPNQRFAVKRNAVGCSNPRTRAETLENKGFEGASPAWIVKIWRHSAK
jgi:hypothetical protein